MREWTTDRLVNPIKTLNVAWHLRFRSKEIIDGLNITGAARASEAVQHVSIFVAIWLAVFEIGIFINKGETLPLPSLLLQAASETGILLYAGVLTFAGHAFLRKENPQARLGVLFYAAVYAILSYIYWVFLLVVPIAAFVEGPIGSNASRLVRNLLILDTGFVFFLILRERAIIEKSNQGLWGWAWGFYFLFLFAHFAVFFVYLLGLYAFSGHD